MSRGRSISSKWRDHEDIARYLASRPQEYYNLDQRLFANPSERYLDSRPDAGAPAAASFSAHQRYALPPGLVPLTPIMGREREEAAAVHLLCQDEVRMVGALHVSLGDRGGTVIGPGDRGGGGNRGMDTMRGADLVVCLPSLVCYGATYRPRSLLVHICSADRLSIACVINAWSLQVCRLPFA